MSDLGHLSDGYHTFDELYAHRVALWIALCKLTQESPRFQYREVWKTKLHSDGTCLDGWFVLGMSLEDGRQLTYHLPIKEWEACNFALELDKAPEFDGHTGQDVINRLYTL